MKLLGEMEGETLAVRMSGDLEVASCQCLENFWSLRVAGRRRVRLDLSELDVADGRGLAVLSRLLHQSLRDGTCLTVEHAPQMLAHTLYKAGLLGERRLELIDPREEEPYG